MHNSLQLENYDAKPCYKQYLDPKLEKLFMCSTCDRVFNDYKCLETHKRNFHLESYPSRSNRKVCSVQINKYSNFTCTYCTFESNKKRDKEKHEQIHHSGSCPYTCDFCWCSFNNPNILKSHIIRSHNKIKHESNMDAFNSVTEELENKIETDAVIQNSPVIRVPRCNLDFKLSKEKSMRTIPAEKKIWKNTNPEPPPKFRTPRGVDMVYANDLCCYYCPKFFSTKPIKVRHEKRHTGEWNFNCNVCSAMFYSTQLRNKHQKSCHLFSSNTYFWCNYCNFHTLQEDLLKIHCTKSHKLKTSESNTPQSCEEAEEFSCNICDASFILKSMLKRHKWKSHQRKKNMRKSIVKKRYLQISVKEHAILQRKIKNNQNTGLFVRETRDKMPVVSYIDQQTTFERDLPSFNFCDLKYDPQFELNFPKIKPNVKQEDNDKIKSIKKECIDDLLEEEIDIE